MSKLPALASVFALTLATTSSAAAAQSAGGGASISSKDGVKTNSSAKKSKKSKKAKKAKKDESGKPFMKRHAPTRGMMEAGIFGGIMLTSPQHELYDPQNAWVRYKKIAPDIGLRFAYYPLSFLGIEIEGAVMPTKTETDQSAILYGFRGHLLAQLPRRIAPFALIGIGALGASSETLGADIDPALQFGVGAKFFINDFLALRLDVRDNVSAAVRVANGRTNYIEVLLGLSATFGRKKEEKKKLIDTDGDGLYDAGQGLPKNEEDACQNEPGPASNQGCPLIDSDGDGLYDPNQGGVSEADTDKCPNEVGPRSNQGCPLIDTDGDGLWDKGQGAPPEEEDACPNEPGPRETQGCPIKDTDGDGFADPGQGQANEDQCPTEPETKNDYQDMDGCPDKIPTEVAKFTGAIRGINFDVDKDTIKKNSSKTLKAAVKVLKDFPDVRIEVSGHTDTDGSREHNLDLSRRRAEAVKKYLVDHGIDASRIETRGAGPDEPVADNSTRRGKAKNRRIEFKLLQGAMQSGG